MQRRDGNITFIDGGKISSGPASHFRPVARSSTAYYRAGPAVVSPDLQDGDYRSG
ncbi:hypothetical protein ACNKHK_17690 [Shigella flexneri]